MNKKPLQKHLFHVLTLSLLVILMGGGAALLYQWHQGPTASQASSDSVVGPPSLPAATVNAIFQRLGSPMTGTGQAVEDASRAQNIDDAFALAVWWTETNDGGAGVGLADRNPGSVRGSVGYPSAYDGYTIYPSYTAAVNYWFSLLKSRYIDRGLTTVSTIAHPYVGTSTSNLWAGKVIALMDKYRSEAPPQPTPTPTIPSDDIRNVKNIQALATANPIAPGQVPPISAQSTEPQTASASANVTTRAGLSGNASLAIVLFDLLLALALGMWGWNMNRRSASQISLSTLLGSNLQGKQRLAGQPSGAFFNTFTGALHNTEGLVTDRISPEFLAATSPLMPAYTSSEALLSLGAFMATQPQYQAAQPQYQTAQPMLPQTGNLSPLGMPYAVAGQSQFARFPGRTLPSRPTSPSSSAPNMLYQTPVWPAQPGNNLFAQSETPTNPWQSQPVSVGSGSGSGRSSNGGLLSRYRDAQTRDEQ